MVSCNQSTVCTHMERFLHKPFLEKTERRSLADNTAMMSACTYLAYEGLCSSRIDTLHGSYFQGGVMLLHCRAQRTARGSVQQEEGKQQIESHAGTSRPEPCGEGDGHRRQPAGQADRKRRDGKGSGKDEKAAWERR
jgi:hypothetical protein